MVVLAIDPLSILAANTTSAVLGDQAGVMSGNEPGNGGEPDNGGGGGATA